MRPIPPPPPTPPPGVVSSPTVIAVNPQPGTPVLASTNKVAGYEISSNFVAGTSGALNASSAGSQVSTAPMPPGQSAPQYEVIPERPGPDYIWKDGYWRWEGAWVWMPGQWIYQPPQVIIVPGPGYYYRPAPWPRYHHRYRRW